ncbi:MAG: hypothetical protein AAGJ35_12185, partial [Myxococcota bacterium]
PPKSFLVAVPLLWIQMLLWNMRRTLRHHFPVFFPKRIRYGDRSQAAQHLYRELSLISQEYHPKLSFWAMLKELLWALRIGDPLAVFVAWGRLCVYAQQHRKPILLRFGLRKLKQLPHTDPLTEATRAFYLGRTAYLQQQWNHAREALETCIEQAKRAQDACLREASLQHLIRVYRHLGQHEHALRVADQLLTLYIQLRHLPKVSASCRHFSRIYMTLGDLRQAQAWSQKALEVLKEGEIPTTDRHLCTVRCTILNAEIAFLRAKTQQAQELLTQAFQLQRRHQIPDMFLQDAQQLQHKISPQTSTAHTSIWTRLGRLLQGHISNAPPCNNSISASQKHFLFQTCLEEQHHGLRLSIPASPEALAFLHGERNLPKQPHPTHPQAKTLSTIFPVVDQSPHQPRHHLK